MNKMRLLLIMMFCLLLAGACTEVDLSSDTEYTNRTGVTFDFDWSNVPDDGYYHETPDTMLVIAKRIVGSWKCGMKVDADDGIGYYLTNAPIPDEPEPTPEEPDEEETDSIPSDDDIVVDPTEVEPAEPSAQADSTGTASTDTGDTDATASTDSTASNQPIVSPSARGFRPFRGFGSRSSRSHGYTRAEAQPGVDTPTDIFMIIPGLYKFITFNLDTTAYIYQDILQYLRTDDTKSTLQELCMEYKRYAYGDSALRGKCDFWKDFNLYGDGKNYIQPDITPIYYDSIVNQRISQNSEKNLIFKPGLLTQNIDIRFKIRKKVDVIPIVIDSVYADISGIPYRLNLSNDYFDIKQTCKMMFQNYLEDANGNRITDTGTNTELYCHGNIDVLSVVNAHDSTITKGPGIMQVMIFVKGYQPIRGMINLYHCIRRANLIDDVGDGVWARKRKNHGVLQIDSNLLIDENLIITEDGDGGLDRWISLDEQEIVIDT